MFAELGIGAAELRAVLDNHARHLRIVGDHVEHGLHVGRIEHGLHGARVLHHLLHDVVCGIASAGGDWRGGRRRGRCAGRSCCAAAAAEQLSEQIVHVGCRRRSSGSTRRGGGGGGGGRSSTGGGGGWSSCGGGGRLTRSPRIRQWLCVLGARLTIGRAAAARLLVVEQRLERIRVELLHHGLLDVAIDALQGVEAARHTLHINQYQ